MAQLDLRALVGSQEGRVRGDVADHASGYIQLRDSRVVHRAHRRLPGKYALPDALSPWCTWKWKLHNEPYPAQERRIERVLHVRGEDCQPAIRFHPLQQITDLEFRVPVVAVTALAAFAEQCTRLIEQQHCAGVLRSVENPPQIFDAAEDTGAVLLFDEADALFGKRSEVR